VGGDFNQCGVLKPGGLKTKCLSARSGTKFYRGEKVHLGKESEIAKEGRKFLAA
jgi:hypothetical protein